MLDTTTTATVFGVVEWENHPDRDRIVATILAGIDGDGPLAELADGDYFEESAAFNTAVNSALQDRMEDVIRTARTEIETVVEDVRDRIDSALSDLDSAADEVGDTLETEFMD